MKNLVLLFLGLFSLSAVAQRVVVKDSVSGDPLSGVIIYNESRSTFTTTDGAGRAELDRFNPKELLFFRHMGHGLVTRLKSTIKQRETILLSTQSEGLDEIVISASKFADVARKIPVHIRKIGSQEIQLFQPQTAADLLQRSGAVFVQKSQLGGGSPMIRGFATNRVLITVDGIRMNNAIFRGGNIQNVISIDPFALDRAEVLYGPGTVISGSDAIGGVMNFYTRTLEEPELTDKTLHQTDYALRAATASSERTVHVSHKVVSPKISGLISASRLSLGDLQMGKNGPEEYLRTFYVSTTSAGDQVVENPNQRRQVSSGFDSYHFLAKAKHRINASLDQQVGVFYNTTSDFARYDRLIQTRDGVPRAAEWYYGPQQWFMTYYKLNHEAEKSRYQLSSAYQRFNESRFDRGFQHPFLNEASETVEVINLSLDGERIFSEKSLVRYGVALDVNRIGSNAARLDPESDTRTPIVSRYPDGAEWNAAAAYLALQHELSKRLVFNGGMRLNHIQSTIDFSKHPFTEMFGLQETDVSALTYSAGLNYDHSREWHFRLNASSAFRAPNIDDLAKVFDSEPRSVVVPNPNLDPEKAFSTELGIRRRWKRRLWLDTSFFHSVLNDALIRRPFTYRGASTIDYRGALSEVLAMQNGSNARVYGAEISLYSAISRQFSAWALANFTRGIETDEQGVESNMRHVPPFFGRFQMRYLNGKFSAVAGMDMNGAIPFDRLALSERSKSFMYASDANANPYSPSWQILNLRFNYELRKWQAFMALENITNQRYRPYSSGIAGPGRQLVLGVQTRR